MKILAFWILLCAVAHATDFLIPDFPAEPTNPQLLEKNDLASADEETLLRYVTENWEAASYWVPNVREKEHRKIEAEFVKRAGSPDGDGTGYFKTAVGEIKADRLVDSRRVVDAVLRELGRKGTGKSLPLLLRLPTPDERNWVCWKVFATVQEILLRIDPTQLEERILMNLSADLVAPLLRDIEADVANAWAWTLWEHHDNWLGVSFRSKVRLRTRLWLARAFAASHPQQALEVFQEGLQSQDATIRAATVMIIRSGIGGSLPYDMPDGQLAKAFLGGKWKSNIPFWETLPLPLDRPLLRKSYGGRMDLVWLSREARIQRRTDDVWPLIQESLTNGTFYSRVGGFSPMEYGLSDGNGILYSRVRSLSSKPAIADHGGLWGSAGNCVAEFHADGSVLWESLPESGCRAIAPISSGRIVILVNKSIECRDRRGDLLWKTSLEALDDPRHLVAVAEDRFLLSCAKSIGWLTRDGKYDPVLSNLKSPGWIRYHPTEPWIIFDGGDVTAIVYDPNTRKELGRFDLDDGGENAKSRFPFPQSYFPE